MVKQHSPEGWEEQREANCVGPFCLSFFLPLDISQQTCDLPLGTEAQALLGTWPCLDSFPLRFQTLLVLSSQVST